MYIKEKTLDDLLNTTYTTILENGDELTASKGVNFEIRNAVLTLENPRSRLSISETRSKLISCIGEFFWYLRALLHKPICKGFFSDKIGRAHV